MTSPGLYCLASLCSYCLTSLGSYCLASLGSYCLTSQGSYCLTPLGSYCLSLLDVEAYLPIFLRSKCFLSKSKSVPCADPEGLGGPHPPLSNNHKNIGFLSNTGSDHMKNHKATKPAFNVGPSLARQRNAIEMVFRWRADDGPILVVFGSTHQLKKRCQSWTAS